MDNNENTRSGESQASPYRTGRFYSVDNEWYFSVREAKDQGPFPSKISAEKSLIEYLLDNEQFNTSKVKFSNINFELI